MHSDLCCVVGHLRPSFKLWPGFRQACFEPEETHDLALTPDPQLARINNNITGEYYFLFGLHRWLRAAQTLPQRVVIAQYRRFLTTQAIGSPSVNVAGTHTVTAAQAEALNSELLLPVSGDWLVGRPVQFKDGMVHQFHHAHSLRDLLRFLTCAIDHKILSEAQVQAILVAPLMIPAASIGVVPCEVFLQIMSVLERAALAYIDDGYIAHSGYQARMLGFCLERLHGQLLLQEIVKRNLQETPLWGHRVVVSDNEHISQTN